MDTLAVKSVVDRLHRVFRTGRTKSISWREKQLKQLRKMILENTNAIKTAMHTDLGWSPHKVDGVEIDTAVAEIDHILKNFKSWTKPERVPTPLLHRPATSEILREPYGVALVVSPWNVPLHLCTNPLAALISAGNCGLVKPSEHSPAMSSLLAELIPKYLDADCFAVLQGGISETTLVLMQRFDVILYTGSTHVGRIVMASAAKHLTPVILELGGMCPCIVDETADIEVAARRVAMGKWLNCGQMCTSVNALYVHYTIHDKFLAAIKRALEDFYGKSPKHSADYSRIVNKSHMERIKKLMDKGTVYLGGEIDEDDNYIAPTIYTDVPDDATIWKEEVYDFACTSKQISYTCQIFGPLLPVKKFRSFEEALHFAKHDEKPLAAYLFTSKTARAKEFSDEISCGGICINDIHFHTIQVIASC